MKTIYAVAYMTEGEDGSKDLYVETIAARSREEAVGLSMLEHRGNEITARGEKILMLNVDEHDPKDVAAMVAENAVLGVCAAAEVHLPARQAVGA